MTRERPIPRLQRSILALLSMVFLIAVPAAPAQTGLEVCYFGPAVGESKVIRPGSSVGSILTSSKFQYGGIVRTEKLQFVGRTGEKSFAFFMEKQQTRMSTGGRVDQPAEKQDLAVYWEGPKVPVDLVGFRFLLNHAGGKTTVTILDHPEPKDCRPASVSNVIGRASTPPAETLPAAPLDDMQSVTFLASQLDLNLVALGQAGFNPVAPKTDCSPKGADGWASCRSSAAGGSVDFCRASALPLLFGVRQARRTSGATPTRVTLACSEGPVAITYDGDGTTTVVQTSPAGEEVFRTQFRM